MATEGLSFIGVGSDDSAVGTVAWLNPTQINADDGLYATFQSAAAVISHYLKGLNPGFIAVTGTISSVQLDIKRKWNAVGASMADSTVKLVVGGAVVGPNKAIAGNYPASDTVQSYTWAIPGDTTLTPTQAKAADFGAVLSSASGGGAMGVASVEYFKLSVTYSAGGGRTIESRFIMLREVRKNEAVAAKRRVYFDIRTTDGLTPAAAESSGQPQISINAGAWTNTGIGALAAIIPSSRGRYYADLTQASISGASVGDVYESRYLSANTIETAGDVLLVIPNLSIQGNVSDSTPSVGSIRVYPPPSPTTNEFSGQVCLVTGGINAGKTRKISSYVAATGDLMFTGSTGEADAPWNVACESGSPVEIIGRIR